MLAYQGQMVSSVKAMVLSYIVAGEFGEYEVIVVAEEEVARGQ
jgi:hypothetical protein